MTCKPTLNDLCELQLKGNQIAASITYAMNKHEDGYAYDFSSHSVLDAALTVQSRRLLETVSKVTLVEERLKGIINAEPCSLSLVTEICEKAEKYEKQFNILAKLLFENNNLSIKQELDEQQQPAHTPRDENKSKENIHIKDDESSSEEKLDEVGLGSVDCTPSKWQSYFNTLEENIQNCVIKFPQIDSIRTLLSDLSIFYGKLTKLFLRPESTQSLLEILLPRSASALEWLIRLDGGPEIPDSYRSDFKLEVNNCPPTTYKRHTRSPHFQASTYKSLCKDSAQEFAKISSMKDWNQMYTSVYNRFVEAEVSLMHYLRSTNMRKSRAKNQEKIVYCICRQPGLTSFMLQCELCRDWVHGRCVTLPALKDSETERMRYICPRCECSLRPDLKQVLELLSDLSSLARNRNESNQNKAMHSNNKNNNSRDIYFHQFPEFVAVQLLCDRALCFIKYIQNEIASNAELKQALTDYEHFSNMTMPSFDLIEQNISEELIQPSDHKDVSYAPMDCKKQPSPWELINSATLSKEMQVSRNPRELIVADNIRSSSSRQPDLESQFSDYKQSRKHQSLTSNNNLRMHSGEQKETEAAEALAGLSASLNTQSSVVAGYKPAHNQRSYGNFKSDATTYGQMGNPDSFTARRFNKHETVRHDSGFNSRPTDRSDPSYFHKRNCGQVMSSDHPRDPSRCDRPLHSKVLTNEGESHQTASCLQSTRRFFFPLSVEARRILENLIMEACLLEVHLPQTRWLWQLHLASDRETASCGALHPSIAKIEEDRLKRRILRHLQQSNQSKCSDRPRAGRRKRGSSGAEDNSANVDSKVELSDDSNISSSEISELQKRQRYSSEYSEGEEKQSNSSVSDPVHYVTSLPNRKPYRLRGRASDLAIARRYKLGRPKRLLPVRGRRSVQRPAHAMGYRSMRPGVQKHMYNVKIQGELQYKDRTVAPNKSSKLQLINRTRNLSGQSCIPSRRTGRVYRGERLVRRLYPCSNNEFSDSSTSDEHVDVVAELPLLSEQHLSRSESPRYHKMMSNYSNYARSEIKRRLAFRSDRLNQPSPIMDTYESEQYEDSSTEDQLSNYEDEECPAKPCLNPRTGTVKWVQCEACCQWYHQICVGIHHEFQLPKVYLCRRCHRRSTTTMTPRRKQLSSSRTLGRLPRRHFLSKSSSKLHLRKSVTVSPIKLTSHVSQRLVGWNTRPSLSPCLPKLQPYDDQNASSEVDKDDDAHEGNNDNNIIDQRDAGKSALSQDIPVLKNQLLDSWTDISQSSEESSVKHPANSPIDSSQLDEPPVIDAYEHVSNNSTNTETAETSKGPTEVLLEALDVMSGGIQSNDTV
ncbi:unnamed protein product [Heterobilharzia americana]|nr:unnamed protein product [Heterobilharzia americana]